MPVILKKIYNDKIKTTVLLDSCNNFSQSNPSILCVDDSILINFRCINYIPYISYNKKYRKNIKGWISSENVISENVLNQYSKNKLGKNFYTLNIRLFDYKYSGLEDAILVNWHNTTYLCGTRCDINKRTGLYCIYKLNDNFEIEEETIIRDEDISKTTEKHWSPIEDKPFTFIRWSNPTEILTIEPVTGNIINRTVKEVSSVCSPYLRGNCQTVKYKDGYLSIVHTTKWYVNDESEIIPSYKHCFIQYDNDFNIINVSNFFNFEVNDIEFCCGLQIKNGRVYISYSIYDTIPVLMEFDETLLEEFFYNPFDCTDDNVNTIYEKGVEFLKQNYFYAAASCFSRVFSNTKNKDLEYQSLMRFCICLLAIKYKGVNLFSNDVTISFIDNLLLLKDNAAEPYYLASIYYGFIGNNDKKEFFRKQSIKYRFELPEIKRYLKMW